MFCCTLLSSIAIILMGKRELIALLNLSSWCLVMVERLFLVVPQGRLQFVIVVFPDHTHLLFFRPTSNRQRMLSVHRQEGSLYKNMSRDMRFPTMWFVRPARPQISLRMCAV